MWYFTCCVLNITIKLLCVLAGRSAVDIWWWPFWEWGVLFMVKKYKAVVTESQFKSLKILKREKRLKEICNFVWFLCNFKAMYNVT
jgi:N-glycosylase/DNA lyase